MNYKFNLKIKNCYMITIDKNVDLFERLVKTVET